MTHYAISKKISDMYTEINKIKKQRNEVHATILEHADMQNMLRILVVHVIMYVIKVMIN